MRFNAGYGLLHVLDVSALFIFKKWNKLLKTTVVTQINYTKILVIYDNFSARISIFQKCKEVTFHHDLVIFASPTVNMPLVA